jgi:hypothetical protein
MQVLYQLSYTPARGGTQILALLENANARCLKHESFVKDWALGRS